MKKEKIAKKITKSVKSNPWVEHVKLLSQTKNLSFKAALQKGRKGYSKQKKETPKNDPIQKVEKPSIKMIK